MPDNDKITYKVGSQTFDIPINENAEFIKEFPDAVQMKSYKVDKDTFDIPLAEEKDFIKQFPNAKPLGLGKTQPPSSPAVGGGSKLVGGAGAKNITLPSVGEGGAFDFYDIPNVKVDEPMDAYDVGGLLNTFKRANKLKTLPNEAGLLKKLEGKTFREAAEMLGRPIPKEGKAVVQEPAMEEVEVQPTSPIQPSQSAKQKQPSSLQRDPLNGFRVPKYLYGMKAENFKDPQVIRYTLSKLGVDMSEFTSDDITKTLNAPHANAGDMVEEIARTVMYRRANPEPVVPQEEEGRLTETFKTVSSPKPMVMAPDKFNDIYGFGTVVDQIKKDSKDKPENNSFSLAVYERDQQQLIDINRQITGYEKDIDNLKNSRMSNEGATDYQQINRIKAEIDKLKQVQQKQTRIANQSLSSAQPVLDQYVSSLTDGLKYKQFLRDDGTLETSKINDAAVKIAQQSGLSDEGVVVKYVEGLLGSRAKVNELKPIAEGMFEAERQKILSEYGKEKAKIEEGYKLSAEIEVQAKVNVKLAGDEIGAFITRESDLAKEKYTAEISQDMASFDERDKELARQIEAQNELYRQNKIPYEEAKANVAAIAAQSKQDTDALNKSNLDKFNNLQLEFNQINTKYNTQYKRRQQEIYASSDKLLQEDFKKYIKKSGFDKKTDEVNEKLKKAYSDSWEKALQGQESEKVAKTEKLRQDAGVLDLLDGLTGFGTEDNATLKLSFTSFVNSLGSSIEALGDGAGLDWMRQVGKYHKDVTDILSPAKVDSWSDLLDFGNVLQLGSQLGGSMAPSMLATAGVTMATGGLGMGIGAQMVAGALASFTIESTDMSRRMYLDTVSSTGNAALGVQRADKMWDFQTEQMWVYGGASIPFIGSFWKGLRIFSKSPMLAAGSKILAGGAAENIEELFFQEFPQTRAEKAINANRDAIVSVGEAYSKLFRYVFDNGVYANDEDKKEVLATVKDFKTTAISTSLTSVFGATGAARGAISEYNEKADIKKQGIAYYQKYILAGAAPHVADQQIRRLTMTKGVGFTGTMVSTLFTAGNITLEQRDQLLATVDKTKTYVENAKQQKLNKTDASVYMTLADIHENAQAQVELTQDPLMKDALQKKADNIKNELTEFLVNKETNLLHMRLADGESYLVTIDDVNSMIESNPDLIGDMVDGNFEVNPLAKKLTKQQQELFDSLEERKRAYQANAKAEATPAATTAAAAETATTTAENSQYLGTPTITTVDDGQLYEFRTEDGLIGGVMTSPTEFRIDGISANETGKGKGSKMFEALIDNLRAKGVTTISTVSAGEGAVKMHNKAVENGLLKKVSEDGRSATFEILPQSNSKTTSAQPQAAKEGETQTQAQDESTKQGGTTTPPTSERVTGGEGKTTGQPESAAETQGNAQNAEAENRQAGVSGQENELAPSSQNELAPVPPTSQSVSIFQELDKVPSQSKGKRAKAERAKFDKKHGEKAKQAKDINANFEAYEKKLMDEGVILKKKC